jgi:phosphoglycolate phosphatase-like HAD superfamily hydrolase
VIDDYDEGHPLVTGIVEKRRELYEAAAEAGFDEMVNASSFARNLGNYFLGKTAIVTTAPRDEITPFLRRYKLEEWYPPTHVIGGDDLPEAEPTPDTYREMAERLNVSAPEKLLVIDGVPARLLPAKAMGATVVNLMTGTTVKELNRIQGSERIIDYVAANSAILAETLELPVAKPAPILECSQPELQPAQ